MSIKKIIRYQNEEGFEFVHEPVEDSLKIEMCPDGYRAKYVARDGCPSSPCDEDDPDLFLVAYHRDFTVKNSRLSEEKYNHLLSDRSGLDEYEMESLSEWDRHYHMFPLEAYIHSGIALALGGEGQFLDRRWDVSALGCVFVAKSVWADIGDAIQAAKGLIERWNGYLSGEVYGVVIESYDELKKPVGRSSSWGFCGYDNAMIELEDVL